MVSFIARIDERTFASVSGSGRFVEEFKRDSIKLDEDIIVTIWKKNKIT
jgi:hypothetical protein